MALVRTTWRVCCADTLPSADQGPALRSYVASTPSTRRSPAEMTGGVVGRIGHRQMAQIDLPESHRRTRTARPVFDADFALARRRRRQKAAVAQVAAIGLYARAE